MDISKCAANYVISFEVYDDFLGQKILNLRRQERWPFSPNPAQISIKIYCNPFLQKNDTLVEIADFVSVLKCTTLFFLGQLLAVMSGRALKLGLQIARFVALPITVPIEKILTLKNVGAWVSMYFK